MVREFKLINEKGQEFSLMDIHNFALLTEPDGLGYSYSTEYQRVGNMFIDTMRVLDQKQITGQLNFINYDNFSNFVNFVETSQQLKFAYKIPYEKSEVREFFKDIKICELTKTQKQENGIISETVTFDCLSLWYEEKEIVYTIDTVTDELIWDFVWDTVFTDYGNRNIVFNNKGHTEAPFKLELFGEIFNPVIRIYEDGKEVKILDLTGLTISDGEKFVYNTKDTEAEISKINESGEVVNLFDFLNPNFINFYKLIIGASTIRISAENEITRGKLTIYVQYKII